MRRARAAAWLVLVAAVAIGTTAPDTPAPQPAMRDGFRLVNADLHVHAFPGDGMLAPWDVRREARRRGLDVIAITNHNQLYAARLDRALFRDPPPPLTLVAEELTAPGYHVIAIGIRKPVDWRLPLADAIRAIQAQGGIVIAAHPIGKHWSQMDDGALALLDGVEVAHPVRRDLRSASRQLDALYARALHVKPTIAAIGASDYHAAGRLGAWRTVVLARDLTQQGVFEGIRAGRTVAFDAAGQAYGPQAWVALVAGSVRTTPPATATRHIASATLAWLALVFLVTSGRSRND